MHNLHDDFLTEPSDFRSASVMRAARLKNLHLHIDQYNVNIRNVSDTHFNTHISTHFRLLVKLHIGLTKFI